MLHDRDVHPVRDNFVDRTPGRHAGLAKSTHRTFEASRGEEKRLHRRPGGDEIDLDALVDAVADARNGRECDDRIFAENFVIVEDMRKLPYKLSDIYRKPTAQPPAIRWQAVGTPRNRSDPPAAIMVVSV